MLEESSLSSTVLLQGEAGGWWQGYMCWRVTVHAVRRIYASYVVLTGVPARTKQHKEKNALVSVLLS